MSKRMDHCASCYSPFLHSLVPHWLPCCTAAVTQGFARLSSPLYFPPLLLLRGLGLEVSVGVKGVAGDCGGVETPGRTTRGSNMGVKWGVCVWPPSPTIVSSCTQRFLFFKPSYFKVDFDPPRPPTASLGTWVGEWPQRGVTWGHFRGEIREGWTRKRESAGWYSSVIHFSALLFSSLVGANLFPHWYYSHGNTFSQGRIWKPGRIFGRIKKIDVKFPHYTHPYVRQ